MKRRSFCAGGIGLAALGPLGLAGCGGGEASADTAPATAAGSMTNRQAAGSTTRTFIHPGLLPSPFRPGTTNQNWIGRSQFPNDPYFNGKIDDFRIYRGALVANDVIALMNDQLSGAGLATGSQQGSTYCDF